MDIKNVNWLLSLKLEFKKFKLIEYISALRTAEF